MGHRMGRLDPERRRILLISPRGPLYSNRTGIWKKSLLFTRPDSAEHKVSEPGCHKHRPRRGVSTLDKGQRLLGLLIGFEGLDPRNLKRTREGLNQTKGRYKAALANLRSHGIRLYVTTFILGYDDSANTFEKPRNPP